MFRAHLIAIVSAFALLFSTATHRADETHSVITGLSSTTLSGYVDTSASWWIGNSSNPPLATTPGNDRIENAIPLTASSNVFSASNVGATLETGEPVFANFQGGASVWYRWTVPKSARARIGFSAPANPPLEPDFHSWLPALISEKVFGPNGRIEFARGGTVASADGSLRPYQIGLVISDVSDGVYDSAVFISAGSFGPAPGFLTFTPFVTVYATDAAGLPTFVAQGPEVQFDAEGGKTYWFSIDGEGGTTGTTDVWAVELPAPANDDFQNAIAVGESSNASAQGNIVSATSEVGEPDVGFQGKSVWYRWKAPTFGTISLSQPASPKPFAVFRGNSITNLQLVAKSDTGTVQFYGEEGVDYSIAVYGNLQTGDDFHVNVTGPTYRVWESTAGKLMPTGYIPILHGVVGTTLISQVKVSNVWKRLEIEGIHDGSSILYRSASVAPGTPMRLITIDSAPPSPHVELSFANGTVKPILKGFAGQHCQVAFSPDLKNWTVYGDLILQNDTTSLSLTSPLSSPRQFYRVMQWYLPPVSARTARTSLQTSPSAIGRSLALPAQVSAAVTARTPTSGRAPVLITPVRRR